MRDLGSKTGSLVNGRLFEQQELIFGDVLQFGPFCFRFDGTALVRCSQTSGGRVQGVGIVRQAGVRAKATFSLLGEGRLRSELVLS